MKTNLTIGNREFSSRLFLGTGKFSSNQLMQQAIEASGTEMVTMAMKRIDMSNSDDDMLLHIKNDKIQLLPNTSGVRNADEAILAAQMARECFGTNFINLKFTPIPNTYCPMQLRRFVLLKNL